MVEWEKYHGIDIAKHSYNESKWLVYADKKLEGGEHNPYEKHVDTLDEAKNLALRLKDSEHPNNSSVTLSYVEITEIEED